METSIKNIVFIGFNVLIILTVFTCNKKIDYEVKSAYIYKNLTPANIQMEIFNSSKSSIALYSIGVGDSITICLTGDGATEPFHYDNHIDKKGDSISIVFNNEKYLSFKY